MAEYKPRQIIAGGCLTVVGLLLLFIGLVVILGLCGVLDEVDDAPDAMPALTATPEPTETAREVTPVPESTPTASVGSWRVLTSAQASKLDAQMDDYIDREHAGAVNYADDAEMRYSMCSAMTNVDWDWELYVESGESLVFQGEIPVEDWLLMRSIGSYLMYLVQQPNMDAYMESRRAGETTVPPMPTMGQAYCAHNQLKP